MKKILFLLCIAVCGNITLIAQNNCDEYPSPVRGQRVYDYYNKISASDEADLQALATRFEDSTGFQMAIITREDLDGKDEETYARELGNCWGVGERDVDNGLIVLVSFEDSKWQISTGKKTQIYLTDFKASSIGQSILVSHLKSGEHSTGIRKTVEAIVDHIGWQSWEERERERELQEKQRMESLKNVFGWLLRLILLGIAGFFSWLFARNSKIRRRVKAQIQSWEEQLLAPSKLYDTSLWPQWAKDDLVKYENKYDETLAGYMRQKEKIMSLLPTKPEKAEEDELQDLERDFKILRNISEASEAVPIEISRYETNAGKKIAEVKKEAESLEANIGKYQSRGFVLQNHLVKVQGHIRGLGVWQEEIEKGSNAKPDSFRHAYELAETTVTELTEIEESIATLISNYKTVKDGVSKKTETITKLLAEPKSAAKSELDELMKLCASSVYDGYQKEFDNVDELLEKAGEELGEAYAKNNLMVHDLNTAFALYNKALSRITQVETLYDSISSTLNKQNNAKQGYVKQKEDASAAITRAQSKCRHADVESSTKSKLSIAETTFYQAELMRADSEKQLIDWYAMSGLYVEAYDTANAAYQSAKSDISNAEEERRRAKRRREEEEAAAARRRRQSYYSSSSSSSSSSSGSSFGGGSFGGSGAGGSW